MAKSDPKPRRKLSRSELRLYAKIYLSTQAASAQPAWFGGLRDDEATDLERELLKLSTELYTGKIFGSTHEILTYILSLRAK